MIILSMLMSTCVGNLKVVNDSAERGIKLIEDFKKKVTKDEHQKQFLLQVRHAFIILHFSILKKINFFVFSDCPRLPP